MNTNPVVQIQFLARRSEALLLESHQAEDCCDFSRADALLESAFKLLSLALARCNAMGVPMPPIIPRPAPEPPKVA